MLHRRDAMIRLGQAGLGALTLPGLLRAEQIAASSRLRASAKNCILLYLWGGPPQQDMWDMKPEAPDGIRSQFKPIDTVVPGIQICDQLPQIARHTEKMAIVRSFTHPSNTHEVGVYHTLTGKINNTLAVPRNMRNRNDFPNTGAVVSYFSPPAAMPASVTIPRPIGHDGVIYSGTYAGFLGAQYDPMELKSPGEVNAPPPHSLDLLDGVDANRLQARCGLLKLLEDYDRIAQQRGPLKGPRGLEQFREQAFRMLMSPEARGAFDLARENDQLRDRYGRNEYGESFLLARRLVESGVRLVTVVWYYICPDGNVANVWDNHGGTASLGGITGYQMLKEKYCLPPLDRAYSALLEDLSARGLLDETLVVMLGEFGRTPKINKAAGRDHWGACQSVVLAGGGIRGGQVYGASDRHAAYPKNNPVSPEDVIATMYHALGIPPESLIHDREHRPHRISEGRPLVELFV
ncbi:MAG: DUF1501 domain-containing protein [Planctomycetia bacterium]|nr:DUF1501 domain-containing protein [Planctomycetia bacterium]